LAAAPEILGQGKVIMDIIALLNPIGAPLVYFPTVFITKRRSVGSGSATGATKAARCVLCQTSTGEFQSNAPREPHPEFERRPTVVVQCTFVGSAL
jgi:hypothetical protein